MRKLSMLIMLFGILLITSCTEYTLTPKVDAEEIEAAYQEDTVQYVIVKNNGDIYYFKVDENKLVPEVKLMDENVIGPLFLSIFLALMFFVIGFALNTD